MKQYMVIAELKYTGFIIGVSDDFNTAESKAEEIFELSNNYPFNELFKLSKQLKEYQKYEINGNAEYVGKFKLSSSNGAFSVYIMEIDKQFSLGQFISERNNTSYAVISEADDIIPEVVFYAN